MKYAVICLFAFMAVAYVAARPEESSEKGQYTSKFDDIDVDQILKSDRLLKNYMNCLMDRGKCPPDAAELKRVLPEALETNCAKCRPKQRELAEHAIRYLIENRKTMWDELADKYDPEKKFRIKYEEEAKKRGIKI